MGRRRAKAMADQITTVSKLRLINRAGHVNLAEMRDVEIAIRVQLASSRAGQSA